jgi:hypothetical protein
VTIFVSPPVAVDWALDRLVFADGLPSRAGEEETTIARVAAGILGIWPRRPVIVGRVAWLAVDSTIKRETAPTPWIGLAGESAAIPPFELLSGDGIAIVRPRAGEIRVLALAHDELHVLAERLVAAEGGIDFSLRGFAGIITAQADVVVALRGQGTVALTSGGEPIVLQVLAGRTLEVDVSALLGWLGPLELNFDRARRVWVFAGEGAVILDSASEAIETRRNG